MTTESKPPKVWRYCLPSVNGEGWAEFLICESGMVAVISDYGNYAFGWMRRHLPDPQDIRHFVVHDLARDWHYTAAKFMLGAGLREVYDGEKVLKRIRRSLIEQRKHEDLDAQAFRSELRLLEQHDILTSAEDFSEWCSDTKIHDPHDFWSTSIPANLQCLCKQTMPRLAELIQKDLEETA